MIDPIRYTLRRAAPLLVLLVAACGSTPPTEFYTLSAIEPATGDSTAEAPRDLAVGVGPVTLPPYLDRPQIVTRANAHRMKLADFQNWAEPLQATLSRTLVGNMSTLLGTNDVFGLPQRRDRRYDYQVVVDITRFDTDTQRVAVLDAQWFIYDGGNDRLLRGDSSRFTEALPDDDHTYSAIAGALSHVVEALSREIAADIDDLTS